MPLIVKRDDSGAQLKDQVADVRSVQGGVVYLYFMNNSFRRHFLLPSKKDMQTPAGSKMENRALKRYRIYDRKGMGTKNSEKKVLERKYSIGARVNTVVDLGVIGSDTAMAELAAKIVAADDGWGTGQEQKLLMSFSVPCVKTVAVSLSDSGDGVSYDHLPDSSDVYVNVVKTGSRVYSVSHLTLS